MSMEKAASFRPRIVIHGGAGNLSRDNLPADAYNAYRDALLDIVEQAAQRLSQHGSTSLDVATYAVSLLENHRLFNAGHGAVYTTAGTHELEASVMVSRGYRKRGVGVMKVGKAKNPIKLAREMLVRGEQSDGGGAQGHCQLHGAICDELAVKWGLETVPPSYFWTRRRWDEHRRGLGKSYDDETYHRHKRQADEQANAIVPSVCLDQSSDVVDATIDPGWDGKEYLPQGTVGAVVMDSTGTLCVATSTGGLTNKLPGRIGDTPTLGAGFWAEEWLNYPDVPPSPSILTQLSDLVSTCLPALTPYTRLPSEFTSPPPPPIRAVAMSGTGNGDSFLRLSAVRTAAAIARWTRNGPVTGGKIPLQDVVSEVAGPHGMLQRSAEDRWLKSGEGEGGIIGIDFSEERGRVVFDWNCGGMFHAWIDEEDRARFQVFRDRVDTRNFR